MLSAREGAFTTTPSSPHPGRSVYNPCSPSSASTPFPKPPPAQARSCSTCRCPHCPCRPSCPSHRPGQLSQTTLLGPNYQVLQSLEREVPGGYRFPECIRRNTRHFPHSGLRQGAVPLGQGEQGKKTRPWHHHYSSHNHGSPRGDQLRASCRKLKGLFCDAYLSLTVCNESEEGYLSPL